VREFGDALRELPGTQAAGAVLNLHLANNRWTMSIEREGMDIPGDTKKDTPVVSFNVITPGYLDAVGIPLKRGRDFTPADTPESPHVALVNEAAARQLWPGEDPIGKRWRFSAEDPRGWYTIVGVIPDVRQHVSTDEKYISELVVPHTQWPASSMRWVVRSTDKPAGTIGAVRRTLKARSADLMFADARTMDESVRLALWESRIYAQLMGVFSVVALIIAALGIHGVMAYTVAQRTREIGIRMALGAAREDVQRMVMGQAMRLTLWGAGIGLALAYALTRFMQSQLLGVRPDDPPTFVGVTLILALSSVVAAWIPTARAVRVDPVVALRHE
jgi:putative ABC transport system permease protein